jgi:hypothetical protein
MFFHYFRQKKAMSVHFRDKCYVVQDVDCRVPVETKWNKRQPNLIMRGFASEVIFEGDKAIIK